MTNKRIFIKPRKKKTKGIELKSNKLNYLKYGIISLEHGILFNKQLEAFRRTLNKHLKINKKIICRIFPNIGITKKPIEVRMGNGRGDIIDYIFKIKPGKVIYEISGESIKEIKIAIKKGSKKLPIKTKIICIYEYKNIKMYYK